MEPRERLGREEEVDEENGHHQELIQALPYSDRMDARANGGRKGSIKLQQHRLYLLDHASKCDAGPDGCDRPMCKLMKKLLRHMEDCDDDECEYGGCVPSRSLLEHFKGCKDDKCDLCVPARDKIVAEYWKGTRQKLSFSAEFFGDTQRKLSFQNL